MIHLIDAVFLFIILGFAFFGLIFGFVHTFGSLLGTVLGAFVASRYFNILALWLVGFTGWSENVCRIIMFSAIFFAVNRIFSILVVFIDKFFDIFSKLPFIGSLNKLFGFVFGALEGILSIGLVIYFIERFPLSELFMSRLSESVLAPWASKAAVVFLPFLPHAIKILNSTIDYVENRFFM